MEDINFESEAEHNGWPHSRTLPIKQCVTVERWFRRIKPYVVIILCSREIHNSTLSYIPYALAALTFEVHNA